MSEHEDFKPQKRAGSLAGTGAASLKEASKRLFQICAHATAAGLLSSTEQYELRGILKKGRKKRRTSAAIVRALTCDIEQKIVALQQRMDAAGVAVPEQAPVQAGTRKRKPSSAITVRSFATVGDPAAGVQPLPARALPGLDE
jgi:hypothetical protein